MRLVKHAAKMLCPPSRNKASAGIGSAAAHMSRAGARPRSAREGVRRGTLRKQRAAISVGIGAGFLYGIFARLAVLSTWFMVPFSLMTYGLIFVVPLAVGHLTVAPLESASWPTRIFLPWLTSFFLLATAGLVGWEGSICLVTAAPAVLVSSSVGGLLAASLANSTTKNAGAAVVLLLPFAPGPVEERLGAPRAEAFRRASWR
jgi:hypothetical protein